MRIPNFIMQNVSPNDATLEVYNNRFEDYLKRTPSTYSPGHKPLLRWLDFSLAQTPPGSRVFEIGSGHGRDARYIKSKGFDITCSDGAIAFVTHLNNNGFNAIPFNALKDNLDDTYDIVFANAVVPHFTPDDLELLLNKIHKLLTPGGVFAFNAKQGLGDTWINEKFADKRYIHYWLPANLRETIKKHDYEILFFEYDIPGGDLPTHTWIHATIRKTK